MRDRRHLAALAVLAAVTLAWCAPASAQEGPDGDGDGTAEPQIELPEIVIEARFVPLGRNESGPWMLQAGGATELPDGAMLRVSVAYEGGRGGTRAVRVRDGRFEAKFRERWAELPSGVYVIRAEFQRAGQPPSVTEALPEEVPSTYHREVVFEHGDTDPEAAKMVAWRFYFARLAEFRALREQLDEQAAETRAGGRRQARKWLTWLETEFRPGLDEVKARLEEYERSRPALRWPEGHAYAVEPWNALWTLSRRHSRDMFGEWGMEIPESERLASFDDDPPVSERRREIERLGEETLRELGLGEALYYYLNRLKDVDTLERELRTFADESWKQRERETFDEARPDWEAAIERRRELVALVRDGLVVRPWYAVEHEADRRLIEILDQLEEVGRAVSLELHKRLTEAGTRTDLPREDRDAPALGDARRRLQDLIDALTEDLGLAKVTLQRPGAARPGGSDEEEDAPRFLDH